MMIVLMHGVTTGCDGGDGRWYRVKPVVVFQFNAGKIADDINFYICIVSYIYIATIYR